MEETPLDPEMFGREQPCFGCSPTHPIGFHLHFARRGDKVVTRFTPGEQYQGPPGVMHGGLVTTLADEIAAWAIVTMKQRFGFTVEFAAKLSKPIRIGGEIEGVGWLEKDGSRIVKTAVELHQAGALCYRGLFTFALLDAAAAERVIGGPIPAVWKKFTR